MALTARQLQALPLATLSPCAAPCAVFCVPGAGPHTQAAAEVEEAGGHAQARVRWRAPPNRWLRMLSIEQKAQQRRLAPLPVSGRYFGRAKVKVKAKDSKDARIARSESCAVTAPQAARHADLLRLPRQAVRDRVDRADRADRFSKGSAGRLVPVACPVLFVAQAAPGRSRAT